MKKIWKRWLATLVCFGMVISTSNVGKMSYAEEALGEEEDVAVSENVEGNSESIVQEVEEQNVQEPVLDKEQVSAPELLAHIGSEKINVAEETGNQEVEDENVNKNELLNKAEETNSSEGNDNEFGFEDVFGPAEENTTGIIEADDEGIDDSTEELSMESVNELDENGFEINDEVIEEVVVFPAEKDEEIEVSTMNASAQGLLEAVIDDIIVGVKSVAISGQKTVLKVGDKDYPKVTILPETATNQNVVWSSKNTNVATVSSTGQVQAVGVGKTTITVAAEENATIFDIYVLEVKAAYNDETAVESVRITNKKADMRAGEILPLAYEVLPATATNKAVSWSSSDTAVAKIDEHGVVTAVAKGECTITILSDEDYSITDSYKLKVSGYVYPTSISCWVTETPVVMSETKNYYMAYAMWPADVSNTKVIWTSSDTSVATINAENGTMRVHKLGKTIITARSELDPEVYGQYVINVYNKPITALTIQGKGQMAVGEVQTLIAVVDPADATDQSLVWRTSDANIASIDSTGIVRAISPGNVEITVEASANSSISAKKTIVITAQNVNISSIYLTGRTQLEVGDESTLTAHIIPENATNQLLWWDSDNYSVATVDQTGKVTAHTAGTAIISAIATDGTLVRGKAEVMVKGGVTHVNKISVASNTSVVLYPGAKYYSTYEIWPASADDKTVSWKSSDAKVATIDATTGIVTAVATGNAIITATSNDDSNLSDAYELYVKKAVNQATKVAVYGKPSMGIGETYAMAYELWPVDADIKTVYWVSTNTNVATVNEYGVVTAVSEGSTFIRAIATDGSNQSGEFRVNVSKTSNKVTRVKIYGSSTLSKDAVDYLAYEIWPVTASDKTVSWKSSNTKVATVNEYGVVSAVSAGTTTISATANDGSNETDSYILTVTGASVKVSALAIHGNSTMTKGTIQYLAYEAWPVNADNKAVTWKSSDAKVATVNTENGTVTAIDAGTVTITATAIDGSGVSTTFALSVTSAPLTQKVTALAIHGSSTMKLSNVQYLAYEAWPISATDKTVTWSSSNKAVATVDADHGIVTAKALGTTVITATANDGSGVKATYNITVSNSTTLVTALAIHGKATMEKNALQYMAYEAWPVTADDKTVSWTSSDPTVISVNAENGTVTALNTGDAIITITANDGSGKTATFAIHVN